jgi:hypothetical protein
MLQTINSLHDRVNQTVKILLFETYVRDLLDKKQINSRQYTVLSQLRSGPVALDQVRHAPWYVSLYLRLNDKTRSRDLHRLREMELVYLDMDNRLSPGFIKPKNVKPL